VRDRETGSPRPLDPHGWWAEPISARRPAVEKLTAMLDFGKFDVELNNHVLDIDAQPLGFVTASSIAG
jgi:hypothetical protein